MARARASMKRFDERDTLFARLDLVPGSPAHEAYYATHPELRALDESLRSLVRRGPAPAAADRAVVDAYFDVLGRLATTVPSAPALVTAPTIESATTAAIPSAAWPSPEDATTRLQALALHAGARLAGVARMRDEYWYSHDAAGVPIAPRHHWGLVLAVEMDEARVDAAPLLPQLVEVARGYALSAFAALVVESWLRHLGADARAHVEGAYQVVAPLVGAAAGLGEMGRCGILVTPTLGPRVRLAVVTTDLPLAPSPNPPLGVAATCRDCTICADRCPGRAIPGAGYGPDPMSDPGSGPAPTDTHWTVDPVACFTQWRRLGTDCGVCLSVCPFSHGLPDELLARLPHDPAARREVVDLGRERAARPRRPGEVPLL